MAEHVLVADARRMTGAVDQHQRVAAAAEQMDRAIAAALGVSDPDQARTVLPTALTQLYTLIWPLYSGGLLSGQTWIDEQHHKLYAHAQRLCGAEADRVIQKPTTESLRTPAGRPLFRV